jgi:NAD(P)-dependent dehydrogenase (short-subunit alcohol dehydrogenase family)
VVSGAQRLDHVEVFGHRTRPTVKEENGCGVSRLGRGDDCVHGDTVDNRSHLGEAIAPLLPGFEVESVGPMGAQLAEVDDVGAEVPAGEGQLIRPTRRLQPRPEVGDLAVVQGDREVAECRIGHRDVVISRFIPLSWFRLRRLDEPVKDVRMTDAWIAPLSASMVGRAGLVTGAGSGIGRACALALAEAGAHVLVSDVDVSSASETVDLITVAGGRAVVDRCDVSDPAQVTSMVASCVAEFDALDFAVNNAGVVGTQQPVHRYSLDDWQRIMAINLTGVFLCVSEQLRVMYGQGRGSIVNIASEASLKGGAADAAYTASKHGVAGLTKTAALEAARRGVRVNAVCPGVIQTGILDDVIERSPEVAEKSKNLMAVGRFGQPAEVAAAVLWLCSDAASLVVGHLLAVDGGWAVS